MTAMLQSDKTLPHKENTMSVTIEIHGFDNVTVDRLRNEIAELFVNDRSTGWFAIEGIYHSVVATNEGMPKGFLRLYDDLGQTKGQQIVKKLRKLVPHVEHVRLEVTDQSDTDEPK
jgi:hypothetical protein